MDKEGLTSEKFHPMEGYKFMRILALIFGFLLMINAAKAQLNINVADSAGAVDGPTDQIAKQDGRLIERLQWYAPHGELPGTYREYLETHPRVPTRLSQPIIAETPLKSDFSNISILVDAGLYSQIAVNLNEYISDIQSEGYTVYLQTVSGGTPEDIKAWVLDRYNNGSGSMVFVGDITAAWAEVSGAVFPCDLFYMDLDGYWEDGNADDIYENHEAGNGDMGPEVYVGRIYATSLEYGSEADMVNAYLAKAHAYRMGTLAQPWRGLEYVDDDWHHMAVNLDLIYDEDVTRYDYGYYTTGADYLEQMDLGQYFVQVCAHSYSGGHHFSTRPTESAVYAHAYIYCPTSRSAKLLLGCDDGIKVWLNGGNVYTNDRYGYWYEDDFEVGVILNSGWNELLCKISQDGYGFEFSARFTDPFYATFDDLEYQINDPDEFGPEAEFIRSWLLNGFHQDISDNFWYYLTTNYLGTDESLINPTAGQIMGGETWTVYNAGCPFIDMSAHDESDYGACYAFARVYADAAKSCQLWIGYDDGARVWLNGSEILNDNRYGDFVVDLSKLNVSLNAGENRLLVKVSEWMGAHGFSARFSQTDGGPVDGLTYDPVPIAITHIGTWLVNGPYLNPDQFTRLSADYLGNETTVKPSQDDPAPFGVWERGIGNGCPFDIGGFYDGVGDWVYSSTIQTEDPPVLFYNLFSCGPGRFTDANYLAGAYIFNTTYGLITVASAKSGSMLNFADFTAPLGANKNFGESFRDWFEAQAPFELWEQEWYYGMVLCGDPILKLAPDAPICGDANGDGDVNVSDAVHIINYIFAGGNPPNPFESGDANCDGDVNVSDAVWIINYIFTGGNAPCDTDDDGISDC
jgi:hypothetical protein